MNEAEFNNASVESLAANLANSLLLPYSLLPVIGEAIEKKAAAEGITPSEAQKEISIRAICWKLAYETTPKSRIDAKWFETARYNAWPRPSRYLQRFLSAARRPRRKR